jgi:magnesium transporter
MLAKARRTIPKTRRARSQRRSCAGPRCTSARRAYFDDVRDYLIRVVDMIDTMHDYLMDSLDIYTTQQSRRNAEETRRVNQSVARLTAVSTIFLPLTFLTGIYGMNFEYIPETEWQYGFYAIPMLCAVIGLGMLVYLRSKKIV